MLQQAFFHLCLYSSLATETYHTGITIQWFCRLDLLTQTHKYTSTNASLSLGHCSLDCYPDHTVRCCSAPSWGDDGWLPGQINSVGSNSKNNTLTQICAHLFSCHWVPAQAQSHCLYCPFRMCACRDRDTGTGAMPCSLQLSRFSPCFLSLSLPLLTPQTWNLGLSLSGARRSREDITEEACSSSSLQGGNGDRGVWFLPFACSRVRTTCKRGSFPHVYLLKIRFVQHKR